jgi:hypothetical protein
MEKLRRNWDLFRAMKFIVELLSVFIVIGSAPGVTGRFLAPGSRYISLITARSAEGNVRELTPSQLETDMKSTTEITW